MLLAYQADTSVVVVHACGLNSWIDKVSKVNQNRAHRGHSPGKAEKWPKQGKLGRTGRALILASLVRKCETNRSSDRDLQQKNAPKVGALGGTATTNMQNRPVRGQI